MKKRCKLHDELVIKFLDASIKDDSDLRFLGNSLRACSYDLFDQESLQAAGFKIIEYLDLKIVKDHIFWGRPLTSFSGSEKELKIALYAAKELLRD